MRNKESAKYLEESERLEKEVVNIWGSKKDNEPSAEEPVRVTKIIRKRFQVRIKEEHEEALRLYGHGNLSAGIERAARYVSKNVEDLED